MSTDLWLLCVGDAIETIKGAQRQLRQARQECSDRKAKIYLADYIGALSRTISGLRELAEGEKP